MRRVKQNTFLQSKNLSQRLHINIPTFIRNQLLFHLKTDNDINSDDLIRAHHLIRLHIIYNKNGKKSFA